MARTCSSSTSRARIAVPPSAVVAIPISLANPMPCRSSTRVRSSRAVSFAAGLVCASSARINSSSRHLRLIREHLLFPDGVRLIDRPVAYRGGPQTMFRRAESSSFFGREIGLMYVHAHLRYAEAMAGPKRFGTRLCLQTRSP
jgi:hypothetical protein